VPALQNFLLERINYIMISKLDGVGTSHSDHPSPPRLRTLVTEAVAPAPESIRWTQTAHEQSAALRLERIAVAAYYMAEARSFEPGHDAEDWLLAQVQIDAIDAGNFEQ
jgi:hypothetical protein